MIVHPHVPTPIWRPVRPQAAAAETTVDRGHAWGEGLSQSARQALASLPAPSGDVAERDRQVRQATVALLRQRASTEEDRQAFMAARLAEFESEPPSQAAGRATAYCVGQLLQPVGVLPRPGYLREEEAWPKIDRIARMPGCSALGTIARQWCADCQLGDSRRSVLRVLLHDPPKEDTPAERRGLLDTLNRVMSEGGPRNDRMKLLENELRRLRATGARDDETALSVAHVGATLAINWLEPAREALAALKDYPATRAAGHLAERWSSHTRDGNARQAIATCLLRCPQGERNSLARVVSDQMRHWAPVEARVAFLHGEVGDEQRLSALGWLGHQLALEGVEHLEPVMARLVRDPEGARAVELCQRWAPMIAPERQRWVYQVVLSSLDKPLDEDVLGRRLLGALGQPGQSPPEEYERVRNFLESRRAVEQLASAEPARPVQETGQAVVVGGVRVRKKA